MTIIHAIFRLIILSEAVSKVTYNILFWSDSSLPLIELRLSLVTPHV